MKYKIVTYGCQMNVHESEKIAGLLEGMGGVPCGEEESADVVVFNTCCIRDNAERRALGNIGVVKGEKKKNPRFRAAGGDKQGARGARGDEKALRQALPRI